MYDIFLPQASSYRTRSGQTYIWFKSVQGIHPGTSYASVHVVDSLSLKLHSFATIPQPLQMPTDFWSVLRSFDNQSFWCLFANIVNLKSITHIIEWAVFHVNTQLPSQPMLAIPLAIFLQALAPNIYIKNITHGWIDHRWKPSQWQLDEWYHSWVENNEQHHHVPAICIAFTTIYITAAAASTTQKEKENNAV